MGRRPLVPPPEPRVTKSAFGAGAPLAYNRIQHEKHRAANARPTERGHNGGHHKQHRARLHRVRQHGPGDGAGPRGLGRAFGRAHPRVRGTLRQTAGLGREARRERLPRGGRGGESQRLRRPGGEALPHRTGGGAGARPACRQGRDLGGRRARLRVLRGRPRSEQPSPQHHPQHAHRRGRGRDRLRAAPLAHRRAAADVREPVRPDRAHRMGRRQTAVHGQLHRRLRSPRCSWNRSATPA